MFIFISLFIPSLSQGHHECEILGEGPEAVESECLWRECKKNRGHENFISVKDFKDIYLPKVHTDKHRDWLRAGIDFTVRLRVFWTSPRRPDNDPFSDVRGTDKTRLGTGLIDKLFEPVFDKHCPCIECNGKITRDFWKFRVRTAHHIVYNTEEAKSTRVDFFYDDDSCRLDGRMKTMTGLEVVEIKPDKDFCNMICVTHDEILVQTIRSAWRCWWDGYRDALYLTSLDFLSPCDGDCRPILIVSHPHGQAKKITMGQASDRNYPRVEYNTATCRGSSGAPVFGFYTETDGWRYDLLSPPVHSGSFTSTSTQNQDKLNLLTPTTFLQECWGQTEQEQCNFGYDWY